MLLRQLARSVVLLALISVWLGRAEDARAYPQWQFSTGVTRCNQCHYSPSGGGLLNDYGREAAGEELSTWEGDGSFLHGAVDLPSVLKLGGDFRFASLLNDNGGPDQPAAAFFPMQADLHARLAFEGFALQVTVGGRGQVRRTDAPLPSDSFDPENESHLWSREHWAIWQPAARGLYVRAGKFFAPFGLRLAEHLVYVRRDLGFNIFQETYNVSVGFLENEWEAHVTGFAPDFLQKGSEEAGATAYVERRVLEELGGVGLQAKYGATDGIQRVIGGVVGKLYVPLVRTLFMAEGNYAHQMPSNADSVGQFVGLLGASFLPPLKGTLLSLYAERFQGDVRVVDTAVNALMGTASWFPYPHFEVQLVGRLQQADGGQQISTFLAQLHYYL